MGLVRYTGHWSDLADAIGLEHRDTDEETAIAIQRALISQTRDHLPAVRAWVERFHSCCVLSFGEESTDPRLIAATEILAELRMGEEGILLLLCELEDLWI